MSIALSSPNYKFPTVKIVLVGKGVMLYNEKLFHVGEDAISVEKSYFQELASKGPKTESKEQPSNKVLKEFKDRKNAATSWFNTFIGDNK